MREEQRVITALVADLKGSTPLGERLHEEEVKIVVGGAVARVVAEVERLGGFVKDLAGDGVLAFFGAPTSFEDDAERAARAALNILESIRAYSSEVAGAWDVPELGVRIGISSGPGALGLIGSGQRVEYAAFGDTVNTAARLEAAAEIGTALVDGRTQRLIEPLFVWTESRMVELKGKAEPVLAFELCAAAPKGRRSSLGSESAAMVGRERERSIMQSALDDVRAGRGGVVLISGDAGVGKSRLVADLQESSGLLDDTERRLEWLEGRCLSYGETVPYFPFRDLVRDLLGVDEADPEVRVRVALRRVVDEHFGDAASDAYPYLASLLGLGEDEFGVSIAQLTAEELQQRTFEAMGRMLERLAEDRPVVVVLEDMHWADATSIQLSRSLLPVVERTALLLVMTQRNERDRAAWALRETAVRDFPHLAGDIQLEPLPTEAERMLLHELVGTSALTDDIEERLFRAADGNPFYLEELVHSLVDSGALVRGARGGWSLDRGALITVPETVGKVILARADRLPAECRAVLAAASVVGRRFDLSLLTELVDGELDLDEALHELQRGGFVVSDRRWPRPHYRFKHVLIQEAIYETILPAERMRLHRAAAELLETRAERNQETVLALARHWLQAGEREQAIEYFERGAELALRVYANEEAVEALTSALDLLEQVRESGERAEEELELRTMLGVALVSLRGYGSPAVLGNYSLARDLSIRLGRPVSPPILRGLAIGLLVQLDVAGARQAGTDLLEAAERENDPLLLVEGQYVLGVTTFWAGEFLDSRAHLEEAITRYAPERHEAHIALYSQDPKVVCLIRLAWTLRFLGYPEQAAQRRDETLLLADELGHPYSRCFANLYAAVVSHDLDDLPRAAAYLKTTELLATDEQFRLFQIFAEALRCWLLVRDGEFAAIESLKVAIARLDEIRQPLMGTYFTTLLVGAHLLAGDAKSGLETVAAALEQADRSGVVYLDSELHRLRGELLRGSGAPTSEIEAEFRLAYEIAQRQEAKALELRAAVKLVRWTNAQGAAGTTVEALGLLETVYAWFTEGFETPELRAARQLLDSLS